MATYSDTGKLRTDTYMVIDDEVFERALTRASVMAKNFIDSYLDGIYAVPFATGASTPAQVREISDLITRHVAQAIQLKQPIILGKHKEKQDGMGMALQWLTDIMKGKASIIGESRLTTRGPDDNLSGFNQIFDLDGPFDQVVDEDLLDEIRNDRKN